MFWNHIALQFISIFIILSTSLQAKELMLISDDELIMRGLLYDEYRAYENSRQVYGKLYDRTGEELYLFREITASLLARTHLEKSIERLNLWNSTHPNRLEVHRLLIPLYLTVNRIKLARTEAEHLIERSSKPMDLELASNPFLYTGEFKRALKLLSKVYETRPQEEILLRMVTIMDEHTHERKKSIQLLETHRLMNRVSTDLLIKLLILYSKEKDIDGLQKIYILLYERNKEQKYLKKIMDTYAYRRDVFGAIAFLEKHKTGDEILYELYKSKRLFAKALLLINGQYKKDKDAKWLAEKGMLLFEKAEDKDDKKMIAEVISYFEKAIDLGVDDSIYLNYYGYTLIDKDIDIQKGMKIIADALIQQPHNTYYLDSLAWGYYKEGNCTKAYEFMKQVVDEEGLKEVEIIEHWNAIKECK